MNACVHAWDSMHEWLSLCVCMTACVCVCDCMHVCVCDCMHVWVCVHMWCIYIYICICVCALTKYLWVPQVVWIFGETLGAILRHFLHPRSPLSIICCHATQNGPIDITQLSALSHLLSGKTELACRPTDITQLSTLCHLLSGNTELACRPTDITQLSTLCHLLSGNTELANRYK